MFCKAGEDVISSLVRAVNVLLTSSVDVDFENDAYS
jgi:hypothetical protein